MRDRINDLINTYKAHAKDYTCDKCKADLGDFFVEDIIVDLETDSCLCPNCCNNVVNIDSKIIKDICKESW